MESKPVPKEWSDLDDAELIERAARAAGEISLTFFKSDNKIWYKNGSSPVSEADHCVDNYLHELFNELRPSYGWLSEETEDNHERLDKQKVLVVDPIDGTRGFLDGRPEWCISIAIVEAERPVNAVLYCPAMDRLFQASAGNGAMENGNLLETRCMNNPPKATGSKKLISRMREKGHDLFEISEFVPSLAYRIALVATGEIDAAFAHGGASEWDLAAVDLILAEAGGKLSDNKGIQLRYNQPSVGMPSLLAASQDHHEAILSLAKKHRILH